MTEFTKIWEKHEYELKKHFANVGSFCVWLGKNENRLPFPYSVRDIIELRLNSSKV